MIVTPVMEDDVCGHDVGYVQFGKKGEHFPLTNMQFIYEKYTNRRWCIFEFKNKKIQGSRAVRKGPPASIMELVFVCLCPLHFLISVLLLYAIHPTLCCSKRKGVGAPCSL